MCDFASCSSGIPNSPCTFREGRRCGAGDGRRANDRTSALPTLAVRCRGNVKLSFGSFGTGWRRVKNASWSKVSQGDRPWSEMERGLLIRVGFL